MSHRALWLGKEKRLIGFEKFHPYSVKEMQEVAQKAYAIQDDKLDTARFLIK
ncbi:MAG TPA: hypothetical protein VH591_02365 [Ktedonobacterales bacterium]|jgi:hypothetical protein